ncbi:hypothetical protein M5689_003539 [Euphorbia peplus]|nr:hypothetical protein M5689_003539 [Euphorbia peplus]
MGTTMMAGSTKAAGTRVELIGADMTTTMTMGIGLGSTKAAGTRVELIGADMTTTMTMGIGLGSTKATGMRVELIVFVQLYVFY